MDGRVPRARYRRDPGGAAVVSGHGGMLVTGADPVTGAPATELAASAP
jgi:hypothetical protein